jgi:hypothetical protein
MASRHPEHADTMEEFSFPFALVRSPKTDSTRRQSGVRLIGSVCAPHDSRLATRRRSRVAGAPSIDESHPGPAAQQRERGPSAKRACAYDSNVGFAHIFEPVDALSLARQDTARNALGINRGERTFSTQRVRVPTLDSIRLSFLESKSGIASESNSKFLHLKYLFKSSATPHSSLPASGSR